MTAYRAILQFVEDGPAVTGYWDNPVVGRTTYKGWVGLYTHDPAVVVQFVAVEETTEPSGSSASGSSTGRSSSNPATRFPQRARSE
ncbi:hypothetical protein ACFWY6_17305 [Streptomyces sp. NPDC059037]|uniref:hypothetical protein n=1 Tax=Streptomyces sp. NPDC059037 TaxID=3346710 RepID=UPI0036A0865B